MKKIKVLVPSGIVALLNHDKLCSKKSMNRIHNNIVEYYLENGVKGGKGEIKNDAQIQFYLYDHLLDRYFTFLRENNYTNESEFLRDAYYDYVNRSKEGRMDILKKIKGESKCQKD